MYPTLVSAGEFKPTIRIEIPISRQVHKTENRENAFKLAASN
jgi:hypothetical protein